MALFKLIKGDNQYLTAGLIILAIVVAFVTILVRLSPDEDAAIEPKTDNPFKIENLSYITLKQSKVQVKLKWASLPQFSESWEQEPQVIVNWRIKTRSGEEFTGRSIGVLTPPYRTFIFSIQDDLEARLQQVHSEQVFVYEYRIRLLRDVTNIWLEITHPETGKVLDTFQRTYDPERRQAEPTWAL
jgi:hypothetical protein